MFRHRLRPLLVSLLAGFVFPAAYAQLSLIIDSPASGSTISGLSASVKLTVNGATDLSRLQMRLNNQDVAAKLISSASCKASSCTSSATFGSSDGLKAGSNYLGGSMSTSTGAVVVAHTQFHVTTGVGATADPSASLPTSIHVVATTSGVTFSNFPGYSGPVNYPLDLVQDGAIPCPAGVLNIMILNASTLQPARDSGGVWSFCYNAAINGPLTGVLQDNWASGSLVIAYTTANSQPVPYDLSSIGGPSQPDAANATVGFSIIGVLGAQPGKAFISYNPAGISAPLDGVLDLAGTSNYAPSYVFRLADAPGFTITPGTQSNNMTATVNIGYRAIDWGSATPSNYQTPPAESNANFQTLTLPESGLPPGDGGVAVFFLDRRTLLNNGAAFYYTNQGANLAASLNAISELAQGLSSYPSSLNAVVLCATVGNAFDASRGEYITADLANAVQMLGAARYDFAALLYSPNNSFSFVGTLDGMPTKTQTYATTLHVQQQESGVLHGLLERTHQNLFAPTQVIPVPNSMSLPNATRSDIPIQVGLAPPVLWPLTDTPGHIAAYHALSHYIFVDELGLQSGDCYDSSGPDYSACDVRSVYGSFSYESDLKPGILNGATYTQNSAYSSTDFTEALAQLKLEITYVGAVDGYFSKVIDPLNNISDSTVSLVLTSAANSFANDLNASLGTPQLPPGSDNIQVAADDLDTASAYIGLIALIPGPQQPFVAGIAAVTWLASAIVQNIDDTQNSMQGPVSDPFVTQLSLLQSQSESVASQTAIDYATAIADGSAALQGRIYGDWFKLQTFGNLTLTPTSQAPDSAGYYFQTPPEASSYTKTAIMSERKAFALQLLPNFYSMLPALGQPEPTFGASFFPFSLSCINSDGSSYSFPSTTDYSFAAYPSIVPSPHPQFSDFFIARSTQINNQQVALWTTPFGDRLMGKPDPTGDPTTNSLNVSQTWFYSNGLLPLATPCAYFSSSGSSVGSGAPLIATQTTLTGVIGEDGSVPVVATVTGAGGGTPSGTVTFADGAGSLAATALVASSTVGVATATFTMPSSDLPFKGGPLTASYGGDNFFAASKSAAFTVPLPGSFVMKASQFSGVVSANGYVTSNLTITPTHGFTGSVALTCTASPVSDTSGSASCKVIPGSLTMDGHTAKTAEVVVQPASNKTASAESAHEGLFAGGAGGVLALMLFLLPSTRNSRRIFASALVLLVGVGTLAALSGCGSSSTKSQTYQVTVQATTHSQTQTSKFEVSIP